VPVVVVPLVPVVVELSVVVVVVVVVVVPPVPVSVPMVVVGPVATVAVLEVVSPVPCLSAVVGVPSNAVPSLHYHARFLVGAASLGVAQHMPKVASVEGSLVLVAVPVSVLVVPSISTVD